MVIWSSRNEGFEDRERPKVVNKPTKIVLKGKVKKSKLDEVAVTTVSKQIP